MNERLPDQPATTGSSEGFRTSRRKLFLGAAAVIFGPPAAIKTIQELTEPEPPFTCDDYTPPPLLSSDYVLPNGLSLNSDALFHDGYAKTVWQDENCAPDKDK